MTMDVTYESPAIVKTRIETVFSGHWFKHTGVWPKILNGKRITQDTSSQARAMRAVISKWEGEIAEYRDDHRDRFALELFEEDGVEYYEPSDVKHDLLARKLWTVSAALKTPDPDLDQYKAAFEMAAATDVHSTVKTILESAEHYIHNVAPTIDFHQVTSSQQLQLALLDEKDTLLTGVIGYGIRSEILHRLCPAYFAMMTRRNVWGMYFLSEKTEEFIVQDQEPRKWRVQPNWDYDYARFTYYSNFVMNMIEASLLELDIAVRPEFRFGYVSQFLAAIYQDNKDEIGGLTRWTFV